MNRFIATALLWIVPGVLACYGIWFAAVFTDPSRDLSGLNRTLPIQCNSMVFGTSRSAQGVNPEILESALPESGKWFNFSFNLGVSPWNDAYVDAIQKKIACSLEPGEASYFLVFADPWTLDEQTGHGEASWLASDWSNVCGTNIIAHAAKATNPLDIFGYGSGMDLFGVIASIPRQIIYWLSDNQFTPLLGVQSNGWLPNPSKKSPMQKQKAILSKVDSYRNGKTIGTVWPGSDNILALEQCIQLLKEYSANPTIFLLRPPTSAEMRELEDEWFPTANLELQRVAEKHSISFIDTHFEWRERNIRHFNDGHHMSVEGARDFSTFLAKTIAPEEN